MNEYELSVPVVLFIFKRLDTTVRVWEKIREAKPQRLYLISDAPRPRRPEEKEMVEAVRRYVEEHIDWKCDVFRQYADTNMGCGRRIASGISWVFEREEQAIILEDDCVPDITFFRYCQEMLEHYKDDERILMIGGNNPIEQLYQTDVPYLFSHVPFLWGWATWKRSWDLYDFDITSWKDNRRNPMLKKAIPLRQAYLYYTAQFDCLSKGKDSGIWDYQFMYTGLMHSMYGILPSKSLVQNIGFTKDSTHTVDAPEWLNQNVSAQTFPLAFRQEVQWDTEFDKKYMELATRHGMTLKIKSLLGLDVNRSVFDGVCRKIGKK